MTNENRAVHVAAEIERALLALRAAEALAGLGLWSDAVSRAYYAALHYAVALLLTEGIEPKTHGGVGSMLGLHFVRTGKLPPEAGGELARLEQFRTEADYNRFFVFTEHSAQAELAVARTFCDRAAAFLQSAGHPR